jgi:RHS repeat-associated protein
MLDEVGLVHMNGRVYDPAIGKFLSADPIVQAPFSGQSFNRYSYVMNNPLSATDPTGYSSWWVQWRRPIAAIAVAVAMQFEIMPAILAEAGISGETAVFLTNTASGFAAGGIAGGNVQSALQGAFFANANFEIGEATGHVVEFGSANYFANAALHGIVGCAQQAVAGGHCRAGAISGAFSSLAGAYPGVSEAGLIGSAIVGAIASRLAGDSAQNGALTAAFNYLFNAAGRGRAYVQGLRGEALEIRGRILEAHISEFEPASIPQTIGPRGGSRYTEAYVSKLEEVFTDVLARAANRGVSGAWAELRSAIAEGRPHPSRAYMSFGEAVELLRTGKISGWSGHHMLEVSQFPSAAANPANVRVMPDSLHRDIHMLFKY